jgi:hypothetical protein
VSEPLQDEAEVLDGLPVLSDEPSGVHAQAPPSRALTAPLVSPAQTAAVAMGGFMAGAAVVGLVHRRHVKRQGLLARSRPGLLARSRPGRATRRLAGSERRGGAVGQLVEIVASRSLLVDVHLLGSSDAQR